MRHFRKGDAEIGYPIILGHEGSGIVEKQAHMCKILCRAITLFFRFMLAEIGENCLKGVPTQCLHYAENNLSGVRPDGRLILLRMAIKFVTCLINHLFATHTIVRERNAVKVSKNLDLRKLGPLGCGYVTGSGTVLNTLKPHPGQTIAVFGTGAVGLAAMMAEKSLVVPV